MAGEGRSARRRWASKRCSTGVLTVVAMVVGALLVAPGTARADGDTTWTPPPGAVPTDRNHLYVEGQPGEPLIGDRAIIETQSTSVMSAARINDNRELVLSAAGDVRLTVYLRAPYPERLDRTGTWLVPTHLSDAGISISAGSSCNAAGWFAIDRLEILDGAVRAVDARFEHSCYGTSPSIRGQFHFDADDPTTPPGPVNPAPAGLWAPAAGALPASGSFAYVEHLATPSSAPTVRLARSADSVFEVTAEGRHIDMRVTGDAPFSGDFVAMSSLDRPHVGYYPNLLRYPFHNVTRGGIDVGTCNQLDGWAVVEHISWDGGTLTGLDLRFWQQCRTAGRITRGVLHWRAGDVPDVFLPVTPIPGDLWRPDPAFVAPPGNYIHIAADDDVVGATLPALATDASHWLEATNSGASFTVSARGQPRMEAVFVGMENLDRLQVGYYPDLRRYPFHNTLRGGLAVNGQLACSALSGWFVVDRVEYAGDILVAIDLRFEQRCDFSGGVTRGAVHWSSGRELGFHEVGPVRVLDSRKDVGTTGGAWKAKEVRRVAVVGPGLVPAGAATVTLNLTAVAPTTATHLKVWDGRAAKPGVSNLNLPAGDTRANMVVVPVDADGTVSIANNAGAVHVIADVVGWQGLGGSVLHQQAPVRILDTRSGLGGVDEPFGPSESRTLPISGTAHAPASATSVLVNVTAVGASEASHLTLWAGGAPRPLASTLNFGAGDTRANAAVVPLGTNGSIAVANAKGSVDVLVDLLGYYEPGPDGGTVFHWFPPTRVLDSRTLGPTPSDGAWGPRETRSQQVSVPDSFQSNMRPRAVVVNLTAVDATQDTHLTVWASGGPKPTSSSINLPAGDTRANLVVVPTGYGDTIDIYNSAGDVHVLIDVVGYLTDP